MRQRPPRPPEQPQRLGGSRPDPRRRHRRPGRRPRDPDRPSRAHLAARWERERRLRRLVIAVGVMVVIVVIAIVGVGYYRSSIVPPRREVASVNGTTISAGELVETLRAIQAAVLPFGGTLDLVGGPTQVLDDMVETELIRQSAAQLGIAVSPQEVDQTLRDQFYPRPPEGQAADPPQLEIEYRDNLQQFLDTGGVSEKEYREYLASQLLRRQALSAFVQRVPDEMEQVYVHWIRVSDAEKVSQVRERLDAGAAFEEVAGEFNDELSFADANGEVGWVPRGAFPALDDTLFGLEVGNVEEVPISDPSTGASGSFFIKITDGPATRKVDQAMRGNLGRQAFNTWLAQQRSASQVEVDLDAGKFQWVVEQLAGSQPTLPRNIPQGHGG